ncbi:hypothetical protein HLB35_12720 [Halomonas sp. TBZ9]|uniref:Uncharacterized protein n=1 Tax=Vreelandella azerica TaxID=2732867 RepID=A0A7Y3TY60_9GAMM|nr:hypothetical protein [Halomonas azerica]NOG32402.1 hypothetical protein [Halomonas azerica]
MGGPILETWTGMCMYWNGHYITPLFEEKNRRRHVVGGSHLAWLGTEVNLAQLDSLMEDKDMLAENLENLVKKERLEGEQVGIQKGVRKGA